ncbi:Homoserine dehydrogenase [Dispira simplex]|nr:Homoserine dehydrogenase [Dispira simplex]
MLNVAIVGPGLVGKELLVQIVAHANQATPKLAVVGVINSRRMVLGAVPGEPLAQPATWVQQLGDEQQSFEADLNWFVNELAKTAVTSKIPTVMVDCTASLAIAEKYPQWLSRGLHLVTPNKKGFSSQWSLFADIRRLSRGFALQPNAPLVYHESTVGAGLPVLNTLYDLVKTGDKIVRIEGIFSGTLSYLFNEFSSPVVTGGGRTFSEIVQVAKSLGYTEPDPRDDLNGMDVARKVVILARVAGLQISLNDLQVENIVPTELRSVATADEFMKKLPSFDQHFTQLNQQAAKANTVLRYVGVVDPQGTCSVKLGCYPVDHPFANLKGSDNIIAFTTERFPSPLIIQGAGAGAAVTAFGIFSDILKVAERAQ